VAGSVEAARNGGFFFFLSTSKKKRGGDLSARGADKPKKIGPDLGLVGTDIDRGRALRGSESVAQA